MTPSRGPSPDYSGGYSVCAPHQVQVAGQSCSEFSRRQQLPHHSELKDQSQSSPLEPPNVSANLPLEPKRAWSLSGQVQVKRPQSASSESPKFLTQHFV